MKRWKWELKDHSGDIIDMNAHPIPDEKGRYDKFFARLNQAGIAACCGTVLLSEDWDSEVRKKSVCMHRIEQYNDAAYRLALEEKRYIPAITVSPDHVEFSLAQMEYYGMRGVGVVEADFSWLGREETGRILDSAEKKGMLVSLQGGTGEDIHRLTEMFPHLKISVAVSPKDAKEILEKYVAVFVRLSGIWFGNYVLHEWSNKLPTEKLLFASEYPFCNPASKVAAVKWELRHQTEEMKRKISWENAQAAVDCGNFSTLLMERDGE